ncbi:MAG: DUF3540 domain-containing protein [Desulfobacterales bacterium]|nr:DUF3540 domain-containing protein [Desulfobacterales bacterium]
MGDVARIHPEFNEKQYTGPATALSVGASGGAVEVVIDSNRGKTRRVARSALAPGIRIAPGDEVLVVGDKTGEIYVVGLLTRRNAPDAAPERITLPDGAHAEVGRSPGSPGLRVFSKRNELIFEYDSDTGTARIFRETGPLEIGTGEGDILINSGRNVHIRGQGITVKGRTDIDLTAEDAPGQEKTSLKLGRRKAALSGPEMKFTARRGRFHIQETRYVGERFLGRFALAQLLVGKMETVARSIVTKANDAFNAVKNLTQLKTGRMRVLVDRTCHFKAKTAFMKAKKDYKIDAKKIHLG